MCELVITVEIIANTRMALDDGYSFQKVLCNGIINTASNNNNYNYNVRLRGRCFILTEEP